MPSLYSGGFHFDHQQRGAFPSSAADRIFERMNVRKKRALKKLNILLLASMLLLAGCGAAGGPFSEPVAEDGYYLDTICSISIYRSGPSF